MLHIIAIEKVPVNEYLKVRRGSGWTTKVYKRAGFSRSHRAYELDDTTDSSKWRYLKKGTMVLVSQDD